MGYADRDYSYRGPLDGRTGGGRGGITGSVTPWVLRLLVANGVVFALNAFDVLPHAWTARTFGFSPGTLVTQPWTPLTYMFVHGDFWHIFVNMLVLFFFGPPLERRWGSREFLKFYLVAGLGGALISLLLLPLPVVRSGTVVIGASGAIFGLMLAFALLWPEARIYVWGILPVRAKWFVGALALFTLYATFSNTGDGVAHWAHLGGLATGFVYFRYGAAMSRALDRLADALPVSEASTGGGGGPVTGSGGRRTGERSPSERKEIRLRRGRRRSDGADEDTLDEVDRILDKIREHGLESLTREEREFLDEMSRRYRG